MTSFDAQTALDAIHHRQEQTRDEYVRQASSGAYGLIAALGVFASCASVDLPRPWHLVAMLVGDGLIVGALLVQYRRARVRRKQTRAEVLFTAWLAAVVVAVLVAAVVGFRLAGLPNPSMAAAAVAALATLVATYASRPVLKKIARRGDCG
ncbi:hypothetical protein ACWD6P_07995 [Streptomyces sp. NPDC002446]